MEFDFYSSREERLKSASAGTKLAYEQRKKIGFFNKNPQLRILLIDLVVILLFAVIVIPFFVRITKDVRFDDYKVESKAIVFEDKILVSLKITKLFKKINKRIATDSLKVVILKENIKIDEVDYLLPSEKGKDEFITFKFDEDKSIKYLHLNLSSGKYIKEYKVLVER
ncbi:MAG: hypothetical protein OCD02_20950 [Spirochaetaceae bacterium]